MFGISWAEFLVILLVAVIVIPVKFWPDVAAFLGRTVRTVRQLIWRVTDAADEISRQIDLQRPIDDLIQTTTDDMLDAFSTPRPKPAKKSPRKQGARK